MNLKMLREALCQAEAEPNVPVDVKRSIGDMIRLIDVHRPLGSDGKHDNRHTATCGCEDR